MRKRFARLDDLLFERVFQPASDLVALRLGLARGTAACVCLDVASVGWIVSRLPASSDHGGTSGLSLVVLLLGLVALAGLQALFRRAGASARDNPLRLSMQPHRAIVLLMLVSRLLQLRQAAMADAADMVMLTAAASGLYLGACAPHPRIRRGRGALAGAAAG